MGGSLALDNVDAGADNIVPDPSFENDSTDWVAWNSHTVTRTTSGPCFGSWCLSSTERQESWQGPAFNMAAYVVPGQRYAVTAWVRVSVPSDIISIAMKVLCREPSNQTTPSQYFEVAPARATSNVWGSMTGEFTAPLCEAPNQLEDLKLIFQGAAAEVDIYVDDVRIVPAAL